MLESEPGRELNIPGEDLFDTLKLRRQVKEFTDEPVDFYDESFQIAERLIDIKSDDYVLDIGSSSGEYLVEAAKKAGTPAICIGLDVLYSSKAELADSEDPRFYFINGSCTDIPLRDDTSSLTMAHNVMFRLDGIDSVMKGLDEMKRVTKPGGLIALSTNSIRHSPQRYPIDMLATVRVDSQHGRPISDFHPPATNFLLEKVPEIIRQSGGMEIVGYVADNSVVKAHKGEELDIFKAAIKRTAASRYVGRPTELEEYNQAVDEITDFFADQEFALEWSHQPLDTNGTFTPFLQDRNRRGMYVLRNIK